MKFTSDQEKKVAVVAYANEWGKAMAACKVAEWELTEAIRGYVPDSTMGATSAPAMAPAAPAPAATLVAQAPVATPAQEEEKKKRTRRSKEQIAADEAAEAAEKSQAGSAPAAPAAAQAPAAPAASVPAATLDDVRTAMNALLVKWGGATETRPKVMKVVEKATGKTRAVDLEGDELGKALAALKAELVA